MTSTWASHIEEKQLAESRCPESGGEMEARKTEFAVGDCIKSDLKIVGEKIGKKR